ncbi:MAG TPA: hypothetical protein PKL06_07740, partial [Chitinophagales bacterium]|nr:hypothetical protein [Chitinophagales bacterium]
SGGQLKSARGGQFDRRLHKAGYNYVFECASEKKNFEGIAQLVKDKVDPTLHNRILIGEPEALFEFLDSIQIKDTESSKDTTIKGYRVKIEYDKTSIDDVQRKKDSIAKLVMDALQKSKKKP